MVFPLDACSESNVADLQIANLVFHADADFGVKDGAVADGHPRVATPGGSAQAKTDLVVAEQAVLDDGLHVLFEIDGRHQADLPRLIPAVHQAVPHRHLTARTFGGRLGIERVFAGPLALLEASGVGGKWSRPECTVLDQHFPRGIAIGVELHAIAGYIINLAIADRHVEPASGDSVRVVLFGKGRIQQVMDLAVFDSHVFPEDTDTVARGVTDLAISKRDVVGRDLDAVAARPPTIDQVVFIDAGPGDPQAIDALGILIAANFAADTNGVFRASIEGEQT